MNGTRKAAGSTGHFRGAIKYASGWGVLLVSQPLTAEPFLVRVLHAIWMQHSDLIR